MTLQEFYDKAIEMGATPDSEVVVEYCQVEYMRVASVGKNPKIFID